MMSEGTFLFVARIRTCRSILFRIVIEVQRGKRGKRVIADVGHLMV